MSIFPEWIAIDVGTGGTTVVEALEMDLVDIPITMELAGAVIEIKLANDPITIEVL